MTCRRGAAARALAAALAGALPLVLPAAASGAGGWSAPFRLTSPLAADIGGAQVAASAAGVLAVAFTVYDEDNPSDAQAYLALRSPSGRVTPARSVPGATQVLGLAFSGSRLELLTGSSPTGLQCCGSVGALSYAGGRFSAAHTLSDQLTGATIGRLAVLKGDQVLAAFATDRAVWEAQWRGSAPPGPVRLLSFARSAPSTLAAAQTSAGASALGWIGADNIAVAVGSVHRPPRAARVILTAEPGHELDQLALAPDGAGMSAAWTDSWFDRRGAYHSQAVVADLGAPLRPRPLPVAGQSASGLAFAGGDAGEQVLAFRSCDDSGGCWVRAAFRDAGGRFGSTVQLGAVDAGQEPDAAVSGDGSATVS